MMIFASAIASGALVIFGGTPLRIVLASMAAIVIAESTDTEIYQRLITKPWIVRVAGSNFVSIPLDTAIFLLLAFAFALPWDVLLALFVGQTIFKYAVGFVTALFKTVKDALTRKNVQVSPSQPVA